MEHSSSPDVALMHITSDINIGCMPSTLIGQIGQVAATCIISSNASPHADMAKHDEACTEQLPSRASVLISSL